MQTCPGSVASTKAYAEDQRHHSCVQCRRLCQASDRQRPAQTLADLEVIVVDDGSTDNTAAVVQSIVDGRLRYIYQDNQERSAARNRGLQAAAGEYVAFLDADDWWAPDKLEKQTELLDANPALGFVYCWAQQVGTPGPAPAPGALRRAP